MEQLVGLLADGLTGRGHEVTLYATGDSQTSAALRAVHARGYDEDEEMWDWHRAESFNAALAFEHAAEHDVIHAHDFHFALPFAGLTATPFVETPHVEIAPEVAEAYHRRPDVHVVAVSKWQRRSLGDRPNVGVIPHGIAFDAFPFGARSGEHLLFLGRMLADKGPAEAIRVAQEVGMPLILAGPAQEGYDIRAEAAVDGERIRWVGPVTAAERNELLSSAAALLFPVVYPEPFGLVLLEAMACGTPVLASALGAAPEIVQEGVTGFTAPSWEGLAALVPAAAGLDRRAVRKAAEERFDVRHMVEAHEALYQRIADGGWCG